MAVVDENYIKIDSNKLFEGMLISADLYCRYRNNYVLVFKSELLTPTLISKVKQLEETYGSLYVQKECYGKIAEQIEQYEAILRRLEFDTNYTVLKEKVKNILKTIEESNSVPREAVSIAAKIISDKLLSVDVATIFQMINTVRDTEEYLYTHSTNVAFLNGLIAKWLELPPNEITALIKGGLLHDIGKLKIPPEILNKPAKLTEEEFNIVKTHPLIGHKMLIASGELNASVISAVKNHHEKTNGSGYPDGLKFNEISRAARITAVSDMYDAMVTRRVYSEAHSPFEVLAEFANSSFTDLDIDIVNIFLKKMPFELIGKSVLLSNGSIGKVAYIDPDNFAYPLIQIGQKVVQTDSTIKCICMCKTED